MSSAAQKDSSASLADLAVATKHLSREQSDQALYAWRNDARGKNFGMFLVSQNFLTPDALWELTRAQDSRQAANEPRASEHRNGEVGSGRGERENSHASRDAANAKGNGQPRETGKANHKATLQYARNSTLNDLLRQAMALKASDLHIHSGAPLTLRLAGDLVPATGEALSGEDCERLVFEALDDQQRARFEEAHQLDFAFEVEGVGRFRANAYRQQRGVDAVFRAIKPRPPTLKELGLPQELERIADFHQGLVLFTGPAGCGKSSTMAALVDQINKNRPDHILTIEDPVEYVHTSASCNVNQRQVGQQTESFARALRAALREDPDVIVIGELRDLETISLAITAAETGHLVLGTLHTSNAIRTINRLLAVFPPEQQSQIRVMLSESIKAVVSQRLVRRADGQGRIPAVEIMFNNSAIGNLIRDNKTHQIRTSLQTGSKQGQRLLDGSLAALLKDKLIRQEEAVRHADDPSAFR